MKDSKVSEWRIYRASQNVQAARKSHKNCQKFTCKVVADSKCRQCWKRITKGLEIIHIIFFYYYCFYFFGGRGVVPI